MSSSTRGPVSASADTSSPGSAESDNPEVQTLRAIHQVKLIDPADDGEPADRLPNGTYGFTYSPQDEAPIFSKRMFQIFEVHKTREGEVLIIGFISETDARQLSMAGDQFVSIELYPEAYERATRLVGIPKSHILEHRGPTRENGNALRLKVEKFTLAIQ